MEQKLNLSPVAIGLDNILNQPNWQNQKLQPISSKSDTRYRFVRICEISEGKAVAYRLAMENVISTFSTSSCNIIYLIQGTESGVVFYLGVSSDQMTNSEITDAADSLTASFEGNFIGSQLSPINDDQLNIQATLNAHKHLGVITGIPSFNNEESNLEGEDFQGIERLVNILYGEDWQMMIVAEAGNEQEINETLMQIYDLSTRLSEHIKHSVQQSENWNKQESTSKNQSETQGTNEGKSTNTSKTAGGNESHTEGSSSNSSSSGTNKSDTKGTSESITHGDSTNSGTSKSTTSGSGVSFSDSQGGGVSLSRERTDKRLEEAQKHLSETQIERFVQGRSKGMFKTIMYVSAREKATYDRLSNSILSIFQGNRPSYSPLRVRKQTHANRNLSDLLQIHYFNKKCDDSEKDSALMYSIPVNSNQNAANCTWLNIRELALLTGLPCKELPGLTIRQSVPFAVNVPKNNSTPHIELGKVIQNGRMLDSTPVHLPLSELNKHIFITGVTGSGKTTTCMNILMESKLPFLVLEPAKTEYRALYQEDQDIEYYVLGKDKLTPFRFNPFELISAEQNLLSHISTLKSTLTAVFPMEASMPTIVENAIIKAYQTCGWDINSGENYLCEDPWSNNLTDIKIWPTFSDMLNELGDVIKSAGMGKEFEEKYHGSLVSRLNSLTTGIKGRMLNTTHSLDFSKLLDKKIVIELDELKDEEDKALFMGLIIGRVAESIKQRHRKQVDFRHITLIEEAHRLLSRPEPGEDGSKKMGVEMFANMLAEVRKYGESLIIADQIPNKLISDVIKNTNTKIIHRLFAADDCDTVGDAIGLKKEQKDFLRQLQAGETIIYCGGWHASVRAKIPQRVNTERAEIDEKVFIKCGQNQLWVDRYRLLPHTANCNEFSLDPKLLFEFLHDGLAMVNMLLTSINIFLSERNEERGRIILHKLEEQQMYWQKELSVSRERLSEILMDLFQDNVADSETLINLFQYGKAHGTEKSELPTEILKNCLLKTHLEDEFKQCVTSQSMDSIKNIIQSIQSI